MKCLSLWQPWATLVVIGAKKFETRSWPTSHRGWLLIHAAKKRDRESLRDAIEDVFFSDPLKKAGYADPEMLPFGAIIGMVALESCRLIHHDNTMGYSSHRLPDYPERALGNFAPGRFAWELRDFGRFSRPVPFKGCQGIFDVSEELVADQMMRAVQA
ncbi:MAG TPA: ASCH domain-containing protein [Phycisphaerae bacterium]|jgi:hypothetical protein|nr:ASCH domain-containing protein [Phycisphaerae bacterium]